MPSMSVGRGVFFRKTRTDECRILDMAVLGGKLDFTRGMTGSISWGPVDNPTASIGISVIPSTALVLFYTVTDRKGNKTDCYYRAEITTTPCHFGGERWWFCCPSCGRRCRVLYKPPQALYFSCRLCHRLTYKSQQEGKSKWLSMIQILNSLPGWHYRLKRLRSPRKRARMSNKILRACSELEAMRNKSEVK